MVIKNNSNSSYRRQKCLARVIYKCIPHNGRLSKQLYIYKSYISCNIYVIFITVVHTLKANFLEFHSSKLLTHP